MAFSFLNVINPEIITAARNIIDRNSTDRSSYGVRVVQEYELDYIISGAGVIVTDGIAHPAVKGNLFFRKPGMVVEGIKPYSCYYIRLRLFDGLNRKNGEETAGVIPDDFPIIIKYEHTIQIEELFSMLFLEYTAQREIGPLAIKSLFLQIFISMYNEWVHREQFRGLKPATRDRYMGIQEISKMLEEKYARHFSLEELSTACGYSPYTFCRIFKKLTGMTPVDFINNCRITHARRSLLETDKSVKEILLDCGFENESHFFAMFRKTVGLTPLEYRNQARI